MNRFPSTVAVAFLALFSAPLIAQTDEAKFKKQQADRMHKFARQAFDRGFPRQARLIWMQLMKLYDPNHAAAHKALGHVRMGSTWQPDPKFNYPLSDTGSGADGRSLFKKYEALKKTLASAHRSQAQSWAKAGRTDKSKEHYKMVLRWVKTDAKAQAALNHKSVGDVSGTDLEQIVYDRSKRIEKAVTEETKKTYPVAVVADQKHPFLEKAGLKYTTVKSKHFTLRGDHDVKVMQEALVWAERALGVVKVAFPADGGFNTDPRRWLRDWAFFIEKDSYKTILNANADIAGDDLAWKLEHSSTSTLFNQQMALRIGATGSRQLLFDAAVRNVARSYSGFRSAGLVEGIGHTFVGMIFNNNRLFAVDRKKQQGTRASEEDREYTSPNFDVWKDLALEQAWKLTGGVKASLLPLCTAATFTNEQRIKAWSFCDYVMRRDPKLLLAMDRLQTQKNAWDIEAAFAKNHDVTIPTLDKEWEDYWTGASPVMQAIKNDTPPLSAVSRDVTAWLKAFNAARKEHQANPVRWSSNYSTRCKDHVLYLKSNKTERGPGKIQQQNPELTGGSHLGNMFAQMALVSTSAKAGSAKKLFKKWLDVPGYRDALLHNFILSIGLYSESGILVMNVVSGLGQPKSDAAFTCYPRGNQQGVPTQVAVKDLGPELKELLVKNGHEKLKVIGYPLTMHFGISIPGKRTSYNCNVSVRDEKIPGLLVLDDGRNRHTRAPGMVTFYPLKPLKRGKVDVVWSWDTDQGNKRLAISFATK